MGKFVRYINPTEPNNNNDNDNDNNNDNGNDDNNDSDNDISNDNDDDDDGDDDDDDNNNNDNDDHDDDDDKPYCECWLYNSWNVIHSIIITYNAVTCIPNTNITGPCGACISWADSKTYVLPLHRRVFASSCSAFASSCCI